AQFTRWATLARRLITHLSPAVYIYRVVKQGASSATARPAYSEELRQFYHGCVCKDRRRRFTAGDLLLQHNFLLYRASGSCGASLCRTTSASAPEQTQLHAREKQAGGLRRKRKRIASANAEATRERQRLQIRLAMAQKVAKKAAGKTSTRGGAASQPPRRLNEAATVEQLTERTSAASHGLFSSGPFSGSRAKDSLRAGWLQLDTEDIWQSVLLSN
uniref:PIPK domain-containing protein n=1 Tax=Macrostomum lignano TaxID=282301 RepID=A0A1I8FHV4_9PLAT